MNAIETYKHAGLTVEIHVDDSPESPRTWDNASKLIIFGGRNHIEVKELDGVYADDFVNWDIFDRYMEKSFPGCEYLPVYRYEHGNVAYNTTGFNDPWDSGRVGIIICERETIIAEWGKKIASKKAREHARKCMAGEVETYSQWANGEVYGYIVKDEHGNDFDEEYHDSCWGYYGMDYCKQEANASAESIAKKWFASAEHRVMVALEEAGQLKLSV